MRHALQLLCLTIVICTAGTAHSAEKLRGRPYETSSCSAELMLVPLAARGPNDLDCGYCVFLTVKKGTLDVSDPLFDGRKATAFIGVFDDAGLLLGYTAVNAGKRDLEPSPELGLTPGLGLGRWLSQSDILRRARVMRTDTQNKVFLQAFLCRSALTSGSKVESPDAFEQVRASAVAISDPLPLGQTPCGDTVSLERGGLRLYLTADKRAYRAGQIMHLTVLAVNFDDQPVLIPQQLFGGSFRGMECSLTVFTNTEEKVGNVLQDFGTRKPSAVGLFISPEGVVCSHGAILAGSSPGLGVVAKRPVLGELSADLHAPSYKNPFRSMPKHERGIFVRNVDRFDELGSATGIDSNRVYYSVVDR